MLYQIHNSLQGNEFHCQNGTNYQFALHMHGSFELLAVLEGEMKVTVENCVYTVHPGEAVLIFPNQIHAVETPVYSRHFLCLFSGRVVLSYRGIYHFKIPEKNLFVPYPRYIERLSEIVGDENFWEVKGLLYALCGEFDRVAVYRDRDNDRDELIAKIFTFIEENYGRDCSLSELARVTTYHYAYLSRFFKQCMGVSFTEYVNRYRIAEACILLRKNNETVVQIAYACGFNSLRSFNRNFKQVMGATPRDYRAAMREEGRLAAGE